MCISLRFFRKFVFGFLFFFSVANANTITNQTAKDEKNTLRQLFFVSGEMLRVDGDTVSINVMTDDLPKDFNSKIGYPSLTLISNGQVFVVESSSKGGLPTLSDCKDCGRTVKMQEVRFEYKFKDKEHPSSFDLGVLKKIEIADIQMLKQEELKIEPSDYFKKWLDLGYFADSLGNKNELSRVRLSKNILTVDAAHWKSGKSDKLEIYKTQKIDINSCVFSSYGLLRAAKCYNVGTGKKQWKEKFGDVFFLSYKDIPIQMSTVLPLLTPLVQFNLDNEQFFYIRIPSDNLSVYNVFSVRPDGSIYSRDWTFNATPM